MTRYLYILSTMLICLLASTNVNASEGKAVSLNNTLEYTIQSPTFDLTLKAFVITPPNYDKTKRYPVVYAFDADLALELMVNLSKQVSRVVERVGLRPAIVVSIGYGDEKLALQRRIKDLTPYDDHYDLPPRPNAKPWPALGGGDDFLNILIKEIKPFIEKRYSIDTKAETLYGHSLGGLLSLHCLASQPAAFDRYAAASPSLWFNGRKIMRDLITFHQSSAQKTKIPVRLTIGSDEEILKGWSLRYRKNTQMRKKWLKKNQMVTNANELSEKIQSSNGRLLMDYVVYGGLEHAIANAPAFYDALRFASQPVGE